MSLTVKQINDQFEQNSIQGNLDSFIQTYFVRKLWSGISLGRAMDFLFYCILTDSNFMKYKVYKNGGTSSWSSGAQIKRFLSKSSDYLNIQDFSGHLFNDSDTLNDIKPKLASITFSTVSPQQTCHLDADQINILDFLIDDLNARTASAIAITKKSSGLKIRALIEDALDNNMQVVLTGAPGTGKTYAVREYVKECCSYTNKYGNLLLDETQFKFVQFHPSYDYTDFVEGMRPVIIKDQTEATFVRLDGVFKEFCRHIVEENIKARNLWVLDHGDSMKGFEFGKKLYYFVVDEINRADLSKVFGELMFGLEESYRGEENRFDTQYKNLTTYRIITENDVRTSPVKFSTKDIGKAIPLEQDVFAKGFFIPKNLIFIGTMNDIDRSVDSMDFALRRRFTWIDIKANVIMNTSLHDILDHANSLSAHPIDINALCARIKEMNRAISENSKFGLSEAYHIGPAYFKNLDPNDYEASLARIFDNNISSILREYTRGRKQEEVEAWIKNCRDILLGV